MAKTWHAKYLLQRNLQQRNLDQTQHITSRPEAAHRLTLHRMLCQSTDGARCARDGHYCDKSFLREVLQQCATRSDLSQKKKKTKISLQAGIQSFPPHLQFFYCTTGHSTHKDQKTDKCVPGSSDGYILQSSTGMHTKRTLGNCAALRRQQSEKQERGKEGQTALPPNDSLCRVSGLTLRHQQNELNQGSRKGIQVTMHMPKLNTEPPSSTVYSADGEQHKGSVWPRHKGRRWSSSHCAHLGIQGPPGTAR